MHTEIFTLCDAATISGGKLNILGSFDTIFATAFPCHHPMCAVACKLRFDVDEDGAHELEITFSDPDMRPVLDPVKQKFEVRMGEHLSYSHSHAHYFLGFHLEQPGEYYFELKVDGRIAGRIPLYVCAVQQAQA
jgi:hypothetical protein